MASYSSGKAMQPKTLTATGLVSASGKSAIIRAITFETITAGSGVAIYNGNGGALLWSHIAFNPSSSGIKMYPTVFDDSMGILCTNEAFCSFSGTVTRAHIIYDEITR